MNWDHNVIFETEHKYCVSDSFVDYENYCISSKKFLPTEVDITVTWVKFAHSHSFSSLIPKMFMLTHASLTSVQFSHSVVSDYLQPHGLQHASLPVNHQLPEFTQTHVHWISDAIQPSYPLLSPSPPPTFNPSQHQGLFKWVHSLHQVAKVLEFQLQHQVLPMNIQDWLPLEWTGWISLLSKGLSSLLKHHSSKESVLQCSAFFIAQHSHSWWLLEKT